MLTLSAPTGVSFLILSEKGVRTPFGTESHFFLHAEAVDSLEYHHHCFLNLLSKRDSPHIPKCNFSCSQRKQNFICTCSYMDCYTALQNPKGLNTLPPRCFSAMHTPRSVLPGAIVGREPGGFDTLSTLPVSLQSGGCSFAGLPSTRCSLCKLSSHLIQLKRTAILMRTPITAPALCLNPTTIPQN